MCVFSPPFMYSTSIPFLDATVSSSDLSFLTLANQIVISTGCQGVGPFGWSTQKKKIVRSRANADRTSAFSFCACAYILDMRPIQPVLHVIGLVDSNLPSLAKLSCVTEILDFMAVVPITQSNRRACDPGSLPHIFFLSVSRSNLEPCVLPCVSPCVFCA